MHAVLSDCAVLNAISLLSLDSLNKSETSSAYEFLTQAVKCWKGIIQCALMTDECYSNEIMKPIDKIQLIILTFFKEHYGSMSGLTRTVYLAAFAHIIQLTDEDYHK